MVRRMGRTAPIVAAVSLLVDIGSAFAASYDEMKSTAVRECQAIDPTEYQTGLIFNPEGYR